jgi:hypothetical protein
MSLIILLHYKLGELNLPELLQIVAVHLAAIAAKAISHLLLSRLTTTVTATICRSKNKLTFPISKVCNACITGFWYFGSTLANKTIVFLTNFKESAEICPNYSQ